MYVCTYVVQHTHTYKCRCKLRSYLPNSREFLTPGDCPSVAPSPHSVAANVIGALLLFRLRPLFPVHGSCSSWHQTSRPYLRRIWHVHKTGRMKATSNQTRLKTCHQHTTKSTHNVSTAAPEHQKKKQKTVPASPPATPVAFISVTRHRYKRPGGLGRAACPVSTLAWPDLELLGQATTFSSLLSLFFSLGHGYVPRSWAGWQASRHRLAYMHIIRTFYMLRPHYAHASITPRPSCRPRWERYVVVCPRLTPGLIHTSPLHSAKKRAEMHINKHEP